MFISSVLDTTAIDEKQVQSFFSKLTLEKLLYAAVLLVLCAVLIKLILKAADKLFSHSKLDHTIFGFLRTTAKAILIFLAVMLVAGTLGIDTSSLLAILSVAGLAVSLSMQTALSNVAGALMILTGINCALYIMCAIQIVAAWYAFLFLYRLIHDVLAVAKTDARLLCFFMYSFAMVMVTAMVPDHFVLSACCCSPCM